MNVQRWRTVVVLAAFSLSLSAPALASERISIQANGFVFDALAAGPEGGELVLLLHGFPQTSHCYRHQLQALAEAGHRAVAFDQRGYSPGARPERIEDYALQRVVEDVFAIADALGRQTFHLVGHDWGGAAAWAAATARPDRILSLTVLSTPHFAAFGAALADPESEQSKRSSYFEIFAAPGAEDRFLAEDAAFFRGLFGGSGLADEDIQVYVDALGDREAMRAALNWYSALLQTRRTAAGSSSPAPPPSKIQVPTVYVWGELDPAFGRETAEATADFVEADYRFIPLADKGHWLPEEAHELVSQVVLQQVAGER